MSSSTMREPLAIRLQNVSKIYKLHGSQSDQLIDVLGLQRFGIKTKTPFKEFSALSDISLEVPRGHRIGIVGRNGAGKTTLLKLICGNFAPTSGKVEVNGTVQALMNIGLGFHPEYTGRENVEASLQYNGLALEDYHKAMEGIIEFCELGDFLDQPFKTYSLGMQARLMFASATAIKPDILIVDEVLGAGDAYFVAKSKLRVEKLVNSGCTMLLVSHSMQQVLELCDEVIWLDQGHIRMQGEAMLVVKAYEEYLHGSIERKIGASPLEPVPDPEVPLVVTARGIPEELSASVHQRAMSTQLRLQEPEFHPHRNIVDLPVLLASPGFRFVGPGGLSRWDSVPGLKIVGFTCVTERGETNKCVAMRPMKFVFWLEPDALADFSCRYALAIYSYAGKCLIDVLSPADHFNLPPGRQRTIEMVFNPLQLGVGEYIVSLSAHQYGPIPLFNSTPRYDLLNRSFVFTVELPSSLSTIQPEFYHSAEWNFREAEA